MATLTNKKNSNNSKLLNRFAVVKLWPEIKTAEDECISRLKIAARLLNIECLEIDSAGYFIKDPSIRVSNKNVDFVIHLHFDTPKNYDAFSFVALWNPIDFYFTWGYERTTRNLLSHDDFISCDSDAADNHVNRIIKDEITHRSPFFKLHHSPPVIIHKPSLGEFKLFYIGINWEKITKSEQRYQKVLKLLDQKKMIRIYGPKKFLGYDVWKGYKNYIKELPFDGISVINEINSAGICLVFSSDAHKKSELMSNRLFEAVSAGALVICDENSFAKKYFGDSLLYIDGRESPEKIVTDIERHINWAIQNKSKAIDLIRKSQLIFNKQFSLSKNLKNMYAKLEDRKKLLSTPPNKEKINVSLFFLLPEFSKKTLKNHFNSLSCQEYKNIEAFLVLHENIKKENLDFIKAEISRLRISIKLLYKKFNTNNNHNIVQENLGKVFYELFQNVKSSNAFMFVAPNESFFSNHINSLVNVLQSKKSFDSVSSGIIYQSNKKIVNTVHDLIDFSVVNINSPNGFGRFLLKKSKLSQDLGFLLPFLNSNAMAAFIEGNSHFQTLGATISLDSQNPFPKFINWDQPHQEVMAINNFFKKNVDSRNRFNKTDTLNTSSNITFIKLFIRLINPAWIFIQIRLLFDLGFKSRWIRAKEAFHQIIH